MDGGGESFRRFFSRKKRINAQCADKRGEGEEFTQRQRKSTEDTEKKNRKNTG